MNNLSLSISQWSVYGSLVNGTITLSSQIEQESLLQILIPSINQWIKGLLPLETKELDCLFAVRTPKEQFASARALYTVNGKELVMQEFALLLLKDDETPTVPINSDDLISDLMDWGGYPGMP